MTCQSAKGQAVKTRVLKKELVLKERRVKELTKRWKLIQTPTRYFTVTEASSIRIVNSTRSWKRHT